MILSTFWLNPSKKLCIGEIKSQKIVYWTEHPFKWRQKSMKTLTDENQRVVSKKIGFKFRLRKMSKISNRIDCCFRRRLSKPKYFDKYGRSKSGKLSRVALIEELQWVILEEDDFEYREHQLLCYFSLTWL